MIVPPSKALAGGPQKAARELEDIERAVGEPQETSPRDRWNPPFSGDIDMRIAVDGTWYYLGSEIRRKPLVRLFSTVLRREEDQQYYLVTPVEKLRITVDDAPFLAVAMDVSGHGRDQVVSFTTNLEDKIRVDMTHPLRFETPGKGDATRPYVLVRERLEALVNRAVFYDLVELGTTYEMDDGDWYGVWSCGKFFKMAPAAELDL